MLEIRDVRNLHKLQEVAGDLARRAAAENLPAVLRDLGQQLEIDPDAGAIDVGIKLLVSHCGGDSYRMSTDISWVIRSKRSGAGATEKCDFDQPGLPGFEEMKAGLKKAIAEDEEQTLAKMREITLLDCLPPKAPGGADYAGA